MPRITIKKLQGQIEALKIENQRLKSSAEEVKKQSQQKVEDLESKNKEDLKAQQEKYKTDTDDLKEKIEDLTEENEEKQNLLDEREIKQLAQAYADQEDDYKNDVKKWTIGLLVSGIILFLSVGLSIYFSQGKIWFERIEFYLIDLIFISAVWFCVAQYSYYVKLRTDFSNRKTLAQAYHNILNNVEDAPIKAKFIDKATDVLCAKIEIKSKENLPAEKVLKIIESLSKKI